MAKQYGLILPGKVKTTDGTLKRHAIFDEDSDEDGTATKPTGLNTTVKRQDRILHEKAVEEDPTVFQYDELYDDMQEKRRESKLSRKDLDKKPKYISKLLQTAERRKRENERRIERQVQKEREQEGEEFKDKESFVTSSYRKKLEEMRELEEQEKREEYLESIGDVRKQGNLDGFYRHLYDQKVNYPERIKEEKNSENEEEKDEPPKETKKPKTVDKSKYRKRASSESSEESDKETEQKLEHLPSNLDADSDFSIDSSDSENEEEKKKDKKEESKPEEVAKMNVEEKGVTEAKVEVKEEEQVKEEKNEEVVVPKKPKIDVWKKRTVGVVFEEALQRYFARKAARESEDIPTFHITTWLSLPAVNKTFNAVGCQRTSPTLL